MFARAAESFRRLGDATNAANADYNRADVLVRQGRSDEALPLLENTLRVARAVGDEDLVALVRKEMGRAQSRAGDVAAGLILLEEARTRTDQTPRTPRGGGCRHRLRRSAPAGGPA